jgi:hypothetical protein
LINKKPASAELGSGVPAAISYGRQPRTLIPASYDATAECPKPSAGRTHGSHRPPTSAPGGLRILRLPVRGGVLPAGTKDGRLLRGQAQRLAPSWRYEASLAHSEDRADGRFLLVCWPALRNEGCEARMSVNFRSSSGHLSVMRWRATASARRSRLTLRRDHQTLHLRLLLLKALVAVIFRSKQFLARNS